MDVYARVVNQEGDYGHHRIKIPIKHLPEFLSNVGDALISLEKENGHRYCEIYDNKVAYINTQAKIAKEVYESWIVGSIETGGVVEV
ncbi:hypothetical protein AB3N04_00985 (plasmid) [Alkalihalophilus sp. As8PL]|uniref:Uncharacterized protein n=1 Tax=Alkalihalophilus sp. As8PL TaxID=3237103 RepID=A0AB39BNH0_9BACI